MPASLLKSAKAAAQEVLNSTLKFAKISADLKKQGIRISAEELAKSASGGGTSVGGGKVAGRKARVVLGAAQKKEIAAALKGGATASSQAKAFGCSIATVNNIKDAAGLVKKKALKKKAKKKAAKKK